MAQPLSNASGLTPHRDKIESIFANRPRLFVPRTSHPAVDQGVEDRLLENNLAKTRVFPRATTRISQMQGKSNDGYAATHFKSLKRTDGAPLEDSLATPKYNRTFDGSDSLGPELFKRKTRSSATAATDSPPAPERFSITQGLGPEWEQPVVYPVTGKKKTHVEFGDLSRLDEGEFLNDNLIEFYFRWLQETKKTRDNEVYFFGTHFYSSLTSGKRGSINHDAVARWTAKVDIFNYDFVIVPVNESAHWYLALICNLPNLKRSFSMADAPPSDLKRGLESILKATSQSPGDLSGQNMPKTNSEPTLERRYAELNLDGDGLVIQTPSQLASPRAQVRESAAEISLIEDSSDSSVSKGEKLTPQKSPEPNTRARDQNGIFNLTTLNDTPPKRGKAKSIPRKYDTQE
jgi:Ulp1 protease family, C-terminal catalytic domain